MAESKRYAEMTGSELRDAMYQFEGDSWRDLYTALRDAIRGEAYADASDEYTRRLVEAQGRAERTEQMLAERDAEIERLRKDAARLDWLDANPIDVFYDSYRTKGWSVGYRMDYEVRGIRSALDAAAQGNLFGGAV